MVVIVIGAVELLIKGEPPAGYHKLLGLLWRLTQALVAGSAAVVFMGCGIEVKYLQNVGVTIFDPKICQAKICQANILGMCFCNPYIWVFECVSEESIWPTGWDLSTHRASYPQLIEGYPQTE
jgi:hypothetical protein